MTLTDKSVYAPTRFEEAIEANKSIRHLIDDGKALEFMCHADARAMTINLLSQSTAIIISGHARKEEKVQPALGDDIAHSSGVPSVAASDARQARKNVQTQVKSSVRSCNYLGCAGVTVGGIGF